LLNLLKEDLLDPLHVPFIVVVPEVPRVRVQFVEGASGLMLLIH
jgi:hypothetical protein